MTHLDERAIVDILCRCVAPGYSSNDAQVFRSGTGMTAACIDTLVEGTDVPPGMRDSDIARKAIVSCVSDLASKGVRPGWAMVSLTLPDGLGRRRIGGLARGFKAAAREFGLEIIGGDTNRGTEISISVALFGRSKKRIPGRSGARVGDSVFVTGSFGYTVAGLDMISGRASGAPGFAQRARAAVYRPRPPLEFGIKCSKYFTSSIDSSDGLAASLHWISRESCKRIIIRDIPAGNGVAEFAKRNRKGFYDLVFYGGEEFEIVFTAPPRMRNKLHRAARECGITVTEIGGVQRGAGVALFSKDAEHDLNDAGWNHFSR